MGYRTGGVCLMWRWFGSCNCFCSSSDICLTINDCDHGFQYTFTLSGLFGFSDTCCALFNRTWTVSWASGQQWEEVIVPSTNPCSVASINRDRLRARIFATEPTPCTTQLRLETRISGTSTYLSVANYVTATNAFVCGSGASFSLSSAPACSGWPATINVTKV